jgi:hypothetical protein
MDRSANSALVGQTIHSNPAVELDQVVDDYLDLSKSLRKLKVATQPFGPSAVQMALFEFQAEAGLMRLRLLAEKATENPSKTWDELMSKALILRLLVCKDGDISDRLTESLCNDFLGEGVESRMAF